MKGRSVIRPIGLRLEAVEEMKNVWWCKEESFSVQLLYDNDLSQMVGIL